MLPYALREAVCIRLPRLGATRRGAPVARFFLPRQAPARERASLAGVWVGLLCLSASLVAPTKEHRKHPPGTQVEDCIFLHGLVSIHFGVCIGLLVYICFFMLYAPPAFVAGVQTLLPSLASARRRSPWGCRRAPSVVGGAGPGVRVRCWGVGVTALLVFKLGCPPPREPRKPPPGSQVADFLAWTS